MSRAAALHARVSALSASQRALLAARLRSDRPEAADARLVACVSLRDPDATVADLRAFLRERLPESMVPAAFLVLETLPRTPSGKLDVNALPASPAGVEVTDAYAAPANAVEETLATIWSDLLGVRVGMHDNFFEIGGDSILSIQVVARAARAGVRLTPDQLFRHQTVAELAAVADTIELRLRTIWEGVLDTSAFGADDDFFALGGHSLLVARMMTEIEAHFGVRLPVTTFFDAPTLRGLAGSIARARAQRADAPDLRLLVPLAPGEAHAGAAPFFLMHGLRGDVVVCYRLVRHLSAARPVYGLQAEGSDGRSRPAERLEDMAAAYVREICTVQPHGPYFLGGYCFGGTVAYEVARQLAEQGREVALLVLIDSDPRVPRWPRLNKALYDLRMMPAAERGVRVRRRLARVFRAGRAPIPPAGEASAPPPEAMPNALDDAHIAAFMRYVPGKFAGRVTLVLAHDDPPGLARWRRRKWDALAGEGVVVHTVPGTHYELMRDPYVRGLADCVQACLDGAAARAGASLRSQPGRHSLQPRIRADAADDP